MTISEGSVLLDKYRIEALLGQGAFGSVYRAIHLKLGEKRALKILNTNLPGLGEQRIQNTVTRFRLEAQLGARLNKPPHPNLIQVFDFEQRDDLLILIMEYQAGGSLADLLVTIRDNQQLMSVEEALRITRDIAAGLAIIHQYEIVHRDLKPSNILFDTAGRAKIADLGLAQERGGASMRSQLSSALGHPGTPGYMSPEQQADYAYLTPASDIFTVGLILFEMLTGRLYKNLAPGTRVKSIRPEVPDWVDNLLASMLDSTPENRPWDGKHLLDCLGPPLTVPITAALPNPSSQARILLGGAGLIGSCVLAAILVGAILLPRMFSSNLSPTPVPTFEMSAGLLATRITPSATSASIIATASITPQNPASDNPVVESITAKPDSPTDVPAPTPTDASTWQQGRLVFVARHQSGLALFTLDLTDGDSDPQLLYVPPAGGGTLSAPVWSPDYSQVAFYELFGSMQVISTNGGSPSALRTCSGPSWSPDGTEIVCSAAGKFDLVNASNGSLIRQISPPAGALFPVWSPTADEIVFPVFTGETTSIWRMSISGSAPVLLAGSGSENYAPSWSPDGQWIAYQSRQDSTLSEIWIMDRMGNNQQRLTSTPGGAWSRAPYWSPDGNWLVFVSDQAGSDGAEYGEIFVISIATEEIHQLTNTGGKIYNWRTTWGN